MTHHAPPHLPPPPPPFATHLEAAPNCPRCASANTKFCYYNNYSLSQPRYFCKSCRRYWTNGGSLRNVPVARRKSRRSKSSTAVPRPSKSSVVSTQILTESNSSPEIDLAAVFARFLNSDPQTLTSSPESADPLDNPTAENSEIFFEELSDLLLDEEDQKQGITEDYETFPFGLQTQFGVEELFPSQQIQEFDYFSCNYNANHFRVSDQFYPMGDNWENNIDFF